MRTAAIPKRCVLTALVAGGLALAACGDEEDFANEPRPANPLVLTAVVGDERVSVSPARIGAGLIDLVATNQTDRARPVTLRGGRLQQTTGPINPDDTGSLRADLRPGSYTVAAGDGTRAARLTVGRPRQSAQDQLLQP